MRKHFLYFVFFLLALSSVHAFLISPSIMELQFQPGLQQTSFLTIFNNANEPLQLKVEVLDYLLSDVAKQELAGAITVDQSTVTFAPGEQQKIVTLFFQLPQSLSSGTHEVRIAVTDQPAEGGQVGSQASSALRVLIHHGQGQPAQPVLSPPATLPQEPALPSPSPVPQAPPAVQTVPEPPAVVGRPPAVLEELVIEREPEEEQPASGVSLGGLFSFFLLLLLLGALVYFAPLLLTELRNKVVVVCFFAQSVRRGQGGTILIILDNKAHLPAKDVKVEITIKNKNNALMQTFRPDSFTIPPLEKHRLELTWDTKGFPPGNYIFELTMQYHKERVYMVNYAQVFP